MKKIPKIIAKLKKIKQKIGESCHRTKGKELLKELSSKNYPGGKIIEQKKSFIKLRFKMMIIHKNIFFRSFGILILNHR